MAEAKATTNTKNAENSWKEIVEKTRENYLKVIDALSKIQAETEKVINSVIDKGNSYKEESSKMIKEWIDKGNQIRENFQKSIEENVQKSLGIIPNLNNIEFPFKKEFEDLSNKVQDQIKKAFEMFKVK